MKTGQCSVIIQYDEPVGRLVPSTTCAEDHRTLLAVTWPWTYSSVSAAKVVMMALSAVLPSARMATLSVVRA